MPPRAKKEKMPKTPKMRKPRLGRAGRAGRVPAGKAGQKQSQKLVVNVGEKQPFTFPQPQGLTLQDLINFEATRGQRLGTREEAGSIEAMKSQMKPKPVLSEESGNIELNKSQMKTKPVLSEVSSSFEIIKPNSYLEQLRFLKPEPLLSEESGSLEIMKSKMKPRPVLTEESGNIELNKSKPVKPKQSKSSGTQTVEEVFNKPITTNSLFEQIASQQRIPSEAIIGLEPPEPFIEEVQKRRSDFGKPRGSTKEKYLKEGIKEGRNIQNELVMQVEQMQARKMQPEQLRLVTNENRKLEPSFQQASSSSNVNFA